MDQEWNNNPIRQKIVTARQTIKYQNEKVASRFVRYILSLIEIKRVRNPGKQFRLRLKSKLLRIKLVFKNI